MAHRSALLGIALLSLAASAPVQAAESPVSARESAKEAAIESHHQVVYRLMDNEVQGLSHETLDRMVAEGLNALREQGYGADADRLSAEWQELFHGFFAENLGDHAPLNQWLANFTDMLRSRLGDRIFNSLRLGDIDTMNYAIPVVFQPLGDRRNGEHWDKMEYRRHFVPFSGVAAYWGAYAACKYAAREQRFLGFFCKRIAGMVQQAIEIRIAPRLSDTIFDQAQNMGRTPFEFDSLAAETALRADFATIEE